MRMPHRAVQINPRKSKEIQIKRLGFPWIRLEETGLFNGLQPKKKKNFPRFKASVQYASNACLSLAYLQMSRRQVSIRRVRKE
jgi:hypothetical protein